MRGALIHVFTGLALGVALAGLLHAPTELIAQQEARTPVVQPKAATAGPWVEEHTVRVSPNVERELERQRTRRLRPKVALPARTSAAPARPILIQAPVPVTPATQPAEPQPAAAAAKPKPKPKAPPTSTPPPAPAPAPEVVAPPQPVYTPAAEDEGKKSKKSKKSKKQKKPKKDKAEKHDEDDRPNHEEEDDHDEGDEDKDKDKDKDKHDDDDD